MTHGKPLKVFIAGAGGIGQATGVMLANESLDPTMIWIGDQDFEAAESAARVIVQVLGHQGQVMPVHLPARGTSSALDDCCSKADILADCLPGKEAPRMARLARTHDLHYANLTEYVRETGEVREIAQGAEQGYVLQCGLAPGFINILAHGLFEQFCQDYGVRTVDRVLMRVGALTRHAAAPSFYGFTWSPAGVATEYLEPAIAIRDGQTIELDSLSGREDLFIDGLRYEEAVTSGGAADLPEALAGRVHHLDYKTLRYPGHYDWVEKQIQEIGDVPDFGDRLQARMEASVPRCEDDLVVIYVAVEGADSAGLHRAYRRSLQITPTVVADIPLRAIQATTAASLAEVIRILATGSLKGPVLQSQIPYDEFMNGVFVSRFYKTLDFSV